MGIIDTRQEQLLNKMLQTLALIGMVAYLPSLYATIMEQLYILALFNTLAYLLILLSVFLPNLSYKKRLSLVVLMLLGLGSIVLYYTGNDGAGHIWLLCAVVVSSLFGETRVIVLSIIISNLSYFAIFLLSSLGYGGSILSLNSYLAISSNMLIISISLSVITYHLLKMLKQEIIEREELLRFLHHRVNNNLQTIQSLIELNEYSGAEEGWAPLKKQIAAISAANELMLTAEPDRSYEIATLLRSVVRQGVDRVKGEAVIVNKPEQLVELAVGVGDLIEKQGTLNPLSFIIEGDRSTKTVTIDITPLNGGDSETIYEMARNSLLHPDIVSEGKEGKGLRITLLP